MSLPFRLLLEPRLAEPSATSEAPSDADLVAALRKAAEEHPQEADYEYLLGTALARQGHFKEALARLTHAARLSPRDSRNHAARGRMLRDVGRREEAIASLREAVRLAPADLETENVLGVALLEDGDAGGAVQAFRSVLADEPSRAIVQANLGAALWVLGRREEAVASFKRAVQLEPESPDLRRNLALVLTETKDRPAALAAYRHAVRLRPREPLHRLDLADALYREGLKAEAADEYEEALRLDPTCIAQRPASQQARQAMSLAAAREEIGPRERGGLRHALFQGLLHVMEWLPGSTRQRKRISLVVAIVFVSTAGFTTQALLREFVRHYTFRDKVVRIARLPTPDEAEVQAQLDHALTTSNLRPWLVGRGCAIRATRSTRVIDCEYVVPVELLPGIRQPLRFRLNVDEPYISAKGPIFF